jgi:hypothetical protein
VSHCYLSAKRFTRFVMWCHFAGHVHTVLHMITSIGVIQDWEEKSAVPKELPELLDEGAMGKPEAHPHKATAQPMARHRHPANKGDYLRLRLRRV